jgi:hypothetical protein
MQAVSATLAPRDNVELLTVLAGIYRSIGKRDRAALASAKREVLRVLARSPLLVALEREGKVALTPGEAEVRRLAVAFSDEEAARGWAACRHSRAPTITFAPVSELLGAEAPGPAKLAAWLEANGASALSFNPAGPFALPVFYVRELRRTGPRLLGRAPAPAQEGEAWLDLAARRALRARVRELLNRLAQAEDDQQIGRLVAEFEQVDQFHSHFVYCRRNLLLGARFGASVKGVHFLHAGITDALQCGDPHLAVDGLLQCAHAATAALASGGLDDRERKIYKQALEWTTGMLGKLAELDYRGEEIAGWRR